MNCGICGNEQVNRQFYVKEMMFGIGDEFEYFECGFCGCVQIAKIPENMEKYYPGNYYSYNKIPEKFRNKLWMKIKAVRDRWIITEKGTAGKVLYKIKNNNDLLFLRFADLKKNTRILDVGCGSGERLYSVYNAGYKKVLGIDPYIKKDINYECGFCIKKKELCEVTGEFDVIMFNHSFEHMKKQNKILKNAAAILAKNGTIIVRVPIVNSENFRKYGANWGLLDAPRHFYIHTLKSMKLLAEKCLMKIEKEYYDSDFYQFVLSEQYIRGISMNAENSYYVNRKKSIFNSRDIKEFKKKTDKMNKMGRGDTCAFFFKEENV